MKKILAMSGLSFTFIILVVFAAQAQNDEITLAQSIWGLEKRDIVTQYMQLTEPESAGFWKEYDAYETARKKLGMERALLVKDYVDNYTHLTDARATDLIKKVSANNIAFEKLQMETFTKMSKVMSAIRAAQFVQLENYLLNTIRLDMQQSLPFIGELEKIKKK